MTGDESAQDGLRWEDGVPVSARFDDPYYSRHDGLAESRHVFLDGCSLPGGWASRERFCIAELGFGTGLNFCAAWHAWQQTAGPDAQLSFVSFERYPMRAAEMAQALSVWPEIATEAAALTGLWKPAGGRFQLTASVSLHVIVGDAREALPAWTGKADAWFLDGFAPARNPEMWGEALLGQISAHSNQGARLATYSAAGAVRRGLQAAGFEIEKRKGFGFKRDMLVGTLRP